MDRMSRALLYSTTSVVAMLLGTAAAAQDQGPAPSVDTDIIVTARRIEERAQDVPISLKVVSSERLTQANITDANSLARNVPGLQSNPRYSSDQSNFAIRGFQQDAYTTASVGTYFGEVVVPRGGGASVAAGEGANAGNLFDLSGVQVLKGPQGTLFGRNTTGGAVILTPRKPTGRFEGYLEASTGNFEMYRVQSVVNAPLSPSIRLRVGVDHMERDGYLHNASGIGPRRYADIDYTALRGSLVVDIAPNVENYTIASYYHSRNTGQTPQVYAAIPSRLGILGQVEVARLKASGDFYRVESPMTDPVSKTRTWQVINTTTWRATDDLTIKNIASYSRYIQALRSNIIGFNGTLPVPGADRLRLFSAYTYPINGRRTNNQHNITEELQASGTALDNKLNYQAGFYFENSLPNAPVGNRAASVGTICDIDLRNLRCSGLAGAGAATDLLFTIRIRNIAGYAQGTYALTDRLKATAGIRYTYDRTKTTGTAFQLRFPAAAPGPGNPLGVTSPGAPFCSPGYDVSPDCTLRDRVVTKAPTWTLNLSYTPVDDVMVYATYSRGYRQGSANPGTAFARSFRAEKVDNYEGGVKTEFRGDISGTFNLAGFYSDLSNQQLQYSLIPVANLPFGTTILNGGKSRIYGGELESTIGFYRFFRLDNSLTYLNAKLKTIAVPDVPGYIVNPSTNPGEPLTFSPKWQFTTTGTLTLPVDEAIGRINVGATYRRQSSYRTVSRASTPNAATPVRQVDVFLDWNRIGGTPIDLSLFGTNMTNQKTVTVINGTLNSLGYDARQLGLPRMYGARLRFNFGESFSR